MQCISRLVPAYVSSSLFKPFLFKLYPSKITQVFKDHVGGISSFQSLNRSCTTTSHKGLKDFYCEFGEEIIEDLKRIVEKEDYEIHPFTTDIKKDNLEQVLRSYFAMSQAFPYLQAGAYKDLILRCIHNNTGVPENVETSFVVGAFLSFDETGGNYLLRIKGFQALPEILETKVHFHASLLKKDIKSLVGRELSPDYSTPTREYLLSLLKELGSPDPTIRCAAMVAFEMHAGQMIEALWNKLQKIHPEKDKESLEYCRVHVGGDDPQEEYHKMLTQKMVSRLVAPQEREKFLRSFCENYSLNFNWCSEICKPKQF